MDEPIDMGQLISNRENTTIIEPEEKQDKSQTSIIKQDLSMKDKTDENLNKTPSEI